MTINGLNHAHIPEIEAVLLKRLDRVATEPTAEQGGSISLLTAAFAPAAAPDWRMSPSTASTTAKTSVASKVFRGDNDCLVDQLIAACHEHKEVSTAPLPGFGRELQPYFAEGEFVPPLRLRSLPQNSGSNNSTRASSPKQQAGPAPANKKAAPSGPQVIKADSNQPSCTTSPAPPTKKAASSGRQVIKADNNQPSCATSPAPANKKAASSVPQVIKADNNQPSCMKKPLDNSSRVKKNLAQSKYPTSMANVSLPACPGIFSSPNPRELPVPSMNLFKRATSPPAHCPGFLLMGNTAVLVSA
eukprot:gene4570-14750_t